MMKVFFLFISLISSFQVFAQDDLQNTVMPQVTDTKLAKIADHSDDVKTENLLLEMTKKSSWFPELKLHVSHGIVMIEGEAQDKSQLEWLTKTASKLPTVIAVINKAKLKTAPLTDMAPVVRELKKIVDLVKKNLPRVVMGLIVGSCFFLFGLKAQGFSKTLWSRKIPNSFLSNTVARLCMLPLWLMLFYLTLLVIGLQNLAGTIIGGTGVLGIVLGFAFKGIAENYLSGLLLAIRSPFTKGDMVKINDVEGLVQNLNMRGTTIMDLDGNLLLIPNTTVINSVVKNLSVNPKRRSNFVVGVGYADSIAECQRLIKEALFSIPGILKEPEPLIVVFELGTSTVNIRVHFWFDSKEYSDQNLKSAALVKCKDKLLAGGMSLPDEGREIIFADTLKIQMLKDVNEVTQTESVKKEETRKKGSQNEKDEIHSVPEKHHEEELLKISRSINLPHEGKDSILRS